MHAEDLALQDRMMEEFARIRDNLKPEEEVNGNARAAVDEMMFNAGTTLLAGVQGVV